MFPVLLKLYVIIEVLCKEWPDYNIHLNRINVKTALEAGECVGNYTFSGLSSGLFLCHLKKKTDIHQ